mmetsp:Transcript_19335/g.22821  ORF Transcript_19335/g.22821 Transcript_19335/m.22821 type:complete len:83 (+) Transcript_19335:1197-1445(+)
MMDVDPLKYQTTEELNLERYHRIVYAFIVAFAIVLISLISVTCVKEDLKRLRFNQPEQSGETEAPFKSIIGIKDDDFIKAED